MPDDDRSVLSAALPIDWHVSDEIITRYANNMIIQHSGAEFILSFFEALPPLLLAPTEEDLAKLKSIRAECVARIVISSSKMHDFLEAMKTNYARFIEAQQQQQKEDNEPDTSARPN